MMKNRKIFVAGHKGLIGSAVLNELNNKQYSNVVGRTRSELDLLDTNNVRKFLDAERPDVVILAAALVGGIHANNTYRTEFILNNLMIQNNVIMASLEFGVNQLIFLGSSCIYPRDAIQPMRETALLTGPLEFTNRPYALAKIAGLELVNSIRHQYQKNFFSVMPTNLYGPGDNFHSENSHVLPALIRRIVQAKRDNDEQVVIWGSGKPLREFLYVTDCARAIVHLMEVVTLDTFKNSVLSEGHWSHINIGSSEEVSISHLASMVAEAVGYKGKLVLDSSKPDGSPRKLMDSSLLRSLKWRPETNIVDGIQKTVNWYRSSAVIRGVTDSVDHLSM